MKNINNYLFRPKDLLEGIIRKSSNLWPDVLYLKLIFRLRMGYKLNLKDPKTFQEKIQWLKLYNRKPTYTTMVDKHAVKEYVANIIDKKYIIPTIGVWENPEDIDFDKLPNKFVLKTTHGGGGGGIIICRDKSKLDIQTVRDKLRHSLKSDIYKNFREWPYKKVPRRIIAEKLLEIPENKDLNDYKIFCFDGEPKFLKVDIDRFTEHHANYYDMDWNLLPFGEAEFPPNYNSTVEKPDNFEKMVEIARILSKGYPFLRIDLYNILGDIFFGEITFYPASGFGDFAPQKFNTEIGMLINLPKDNK